MASPTLLRECTACEGAECVACCGFGQVEARCYCGVEADLLDTVSGEFVCCTCHDEAVCVEGAPTYSPAEVSAAGARIASRRLASFRRKECGTWPTFLPPPDECATREMPAYETMGDLIESGAR